MEAAKPVARALRSALMADRGRGDRQTHRIDAERRKEPQGRSDSSPRRHQHHRQREPSPRPRSRSPAREDYRRKRRDRSSSPKRTHRRSRSRSRSRSRDRKHRHNRRKRSRSSSSNERHQKEKKKRRKKEKKANEATNSTHWGKYGVISEADMHDKDPEFRTWLVEEKVTNPEVMSSDQLKRKFKEFVEDYNTATLPHEKYYDMHAYEKRMAIIRGGESNLLEGLDTYDANADVLSHKRVLKRGQAEKESYLSREELGDLRRVQIERDQMAKMKLLGMNVDSKTGVRMDTIYDG